MSYRLTFSHDELIDLMAAVTADRGETLRVVNVARQYGHEVADLIERAERLGAIYERLKNAEEKKDDVRI